MTRIVFYVLLSLSLAVPIAPAQPPDPPAAPTPKPTRVAILNFGPPPEWNNAIEDTVGIQITAKAFADAIPILEQDRVTVVIIRVNSRGGLRVEVPRIQEVFDKQYKPRFRTVVWANTAISAAAMSTYVLDEIYFTPGGTFGHCYSVPCMSPVRETMDLEDSLKNMDAASASAHRSPFIARAMLTPLPLSAHIDATTGSVTWRQDTTGEIVVNDNDRDVLLFDAKTAASTRFSSGTAATVPELMAMMGIATYEVAGKSAADSIDAGMRKANQDRAAAQEHLVKYRLAVLRAIDASKDPARKLQTDAHLANARRHLADIHGFADSTPNLAMINGVDTDWFEEQERILNEIAK